MKKLFSLLLLSTTGLFAQATLTFTFPEPGESTVSVTFTSAALTALAQNVLREQTPPGVFPISPSVLANAAAPTDTTVTLSSAANASTLSPGFGLSIDSEILNVVSISGAVVTVGRGAVGTTAASHASGAAVAALRYGSYGAQVKYMINSGFFAIPPPAVAWAPPVNPVQ